MINTDGLVDKLQVCSQSPSVSHAFLGQVWPPLNSATVAEGGGGPAAPARDQLLTNARPPSPLYSRCKTKAAQKSPSSKELCHTNAPRSSAKVVTVPLPKGRPRAGSQVVNKSESGMTGEKREHHEKKGSCFHPWEDASSSVRDVFHPNLKMFQQDSSAIVRATY